jgi:hypothetical protein
MNKKKSVIFHINNNKQFFSEFHENTKIKMLKAYLKDIAHIEDFNLVINGQIVNDDEVIIKDLLTHHSKNELFFKIVQFNSTINELTEEFCKENEFLKAQIYELVQKLNILEEDKGNNI